jgi:hypothetical protein
MKEHLVEFKTAKLARQEYFNERVENAFVTDYLTCRDEELAVVKKELGCSTKDKIQTSDNMYQCVTTYQTYSNHKGQPQIIARPTQSQLHCWLKDVHHILVEISFNFSAETPDDLGYGVSLMTNINDLKKIKWHALDITGIWYKTFEEALEQGLIRGLKHIK